MLSIRRVDRSTEQAVETLGSKPKFWFTDGDRRFLFKADDRGTGEDWAEVVACHLCRLIGLPHVGYELAEVHGGGQPKLPGVVCENMAPAPASLILGNQLLMERDPDYPIDQRFKVRKYTIDSVCEVLQGLDLPEKKWLPAVSGGIESALDLFIGYIMLDAWIANQDRHHENWAAILDKELRLAPTFDHGAGLARLLTDRDRAERLRTKDRGRQVKAYAVRARSAFYADQSASRYLDTLAAFQHFAANAPDAARIWVERMASVDSAARDRILTEVPESRMSVVTKEFTAQLLTVNQDRLKQIEVR